jgi:hypothetical protein
MWANHGPLFHNPVVEETTNRPLTVSPIAFYEPLTGRHPAHTLLLSNGLPLP